MSVQRRIYGRRKGHRLRPGRQRLLDERLPEIELRVPESGRIDPTSLFPGKSRLWLEIGFGGGEHLAAQAAAHPEVGVIGCEPYVTGVARLLSIADAEELENIRVLVDDARLLLAALPSGSLERIFILFPDPWPKSRHHKRRIVNPVTTAELVRLLMPGGELRLATDDGSYARAMLLSLLPRHELEWLASRPSDWRERPADWPPTRYEEKAKASGQACIYLRFARLAGPEQIMKKP
jgi:tRNA (guanine-N7-)-methyltransferase